MLGGPPLAVLPLGSGDLYSYVPNVPPEQLFPYLQTVISQYANSPILLKLIENMTRYLDPRANFDQFYRLVWNIDTAQGYGLDVWGRIVGVNRVLQIANDEFFGFVQGGGQPFDQGSFYSGTSATSNFALTDSAYRVLIFAKALANITDGSIASFNQILLNLFPQYGNPHVTDGGNMTMTYTFTGTLSPVDRSIIGSSGVLPKPAGVSVTVVEL